MLFYCFSPHKGIPPCTAFQLCAIYEYRFVVCFPHSSQPVDKLVEQVLHHIPATPGMKPCKGTVIRRFPILQQPPEIDAALTGLLQFPTGVDPAQIPVYQYLEQHPWIRRRFSPFGGIRFVQFPILQFLKLGRLAAGQVRSPVSSFLNEVQLPVDHSAHIRYTGFAFGFSSQINLKAFKAKRQTE